MLAEGLSVNKSLTDGDKKEMFALVVEPKFAESWKKRSKSHHLMLKLFTYMNKIGCFEFEMISKSFNAFAVSNNLSNLHLMVKMYRVGKELESWLRRTRSSGFSVKRWTSQFGKEVGIEGGL